MSSDRTKAFITAARELRRPEDNAIEHTIFSGGGVRLKGFASCYGRRLKDLLHAYGKRAVVHVNTPSGANIFLDCYDDMEPEQLAVCTPDDMVPKPTQDGDKYQYGAVVYTRYSCNTLSSENLKRLFMSPTLLDVKIRPNGFTVLNVAPTSTKIVGGLNSQTLTNSLVRTPSATLKKPRVYFKRGAAKLANRSSRLASTYAYVHSLSGV